MGPIFDIDIVRDEQAITVVVVGELDLHTAPRLEEQLASPSLASASEVVLDLDQVTFMDAYALGVLVRTVFARELGERLRIGATSAQVERLFHITGLRDVLPLASFL